MSNIDTGGGSGITGDVSTGEFINRDRIVINSAGDLATQLTLINVDIKLLNHKIAEWHSDVRSVKNDLASMRDEMIGLSQIEPTLRREVSAQLAIVYSFLSVVFVMAAIALLIAVYK